jgi:hypothetical protein
MREFMRSTFSSAAVSAAASAANFSMWASCSCQQHPQTMKLSPIVPIYYSMHLSFSFPSLQQYSPNVVRMIHKR